MDIKELNSTLDAIEKELLHRKCDELEDVCDEYDEFEQSVSEAFEIQGDAVDTSAAAGGAPPDEAYTGRTIGREGTIHTDAGATKTPTAEKKKAEADAMAGYDATSTAAKAARAKKFAEKGREDVGDVDHSGA